MDGITFSPMTGCVDVTTTNCTATGLTLARGYVFRATATNNAGTSDYSLVTATANYMFMLGNYGDVWITDELGVFDADGSMYFVHGNSVRKFAGFNPSHSCTSTLVSDSPLLKSPAGNSIGLDAAGNAGVQCQKTRFRRVLAGSGRVPGFCHARAHHHRTHGPPRGHV